MLPEMAASYVIGLPISAALTGIHAVLFKRKMRSKKMLTVQGNLRTVDLYWSDSEGRLKAFDPNAAEKDRESYSRTLFWMGLLCFFLSWIGFFLQLLVMTSIRFLAMPRAERAIFNSRLSRETVPANETRELLSQLGLGGQL